MNEFTKEELEYLHETLDTNCSLYYEPDIAYSLRDKLKFMIDNYCEHECNGEVEIFVDTCSKCSVYLLREPFHDNK